MSILIKHQIFAYAGPGLAIAAIIIFLTVILTFFTSLFLSLYNFLKRRFNPKRYISKNNKKKKI